MKMVLRAMLLMVTSFSLSSFSEQTEACRTFNCLKYNPTFFNLGLFIAECADLSAFLARLVAALQIRFDATCLERCRVMILNNLIHDALQSHRLLLGAVALLQAAGPGKSDPCGVTILQVNGRTLINSVPVSERAAGARCSRCARKSCANRPTRSFCFRRYDPSIESNTKMDGKMLQGRQMIEAWNLTGLLPSQSLV